MERPGPRKRFADAPATGLKKSLTDVQLLAVRGPEPQVIFVEPGVPPRRRRSRTKSTVTTTTTAARPDRRKAPGSAIRSDDQAAPRRERGTEVLLDVADL